jgi:hypothetical protein
LARRDRKAERAGEIFRYTAVGNSAPLDSIVLGRPWLSAAEYGARDGDTITSLPFGTFGGADAIAVHRNAKGIVTEVEFAYHAKRDARALVRDYQSSLGPPISVKVDTVSGAIRTTTLWRDDSTEFVIATMSPPGRDDVGAMAWLIDRGTNRHEPLPNEEL